jgi:hypothetical protein
MASRLGGLAFFVCHKFPNRGVFVSGVPN